MRATGVVSLLLLASLFLAGCSDPDDGADRDGVGPGSGDEPGDIGDPDIQGDRDGDGGTLEADLITPGTWVIRGSPERMMAWVHNEGDGVVEGTWDFTLAGGAPLPAGWQASFSRPTVTLQPDGTKAQGTRGMTYPDWGYTVVTLTVPADAAGTLAAELRVGALVQPVALRVEATDERLSAPGDSVTVAYDGRFHDDQRPFDDGSFATVLGRGQTVVGFDNGLMGLALEETARLVIPPAFAYGYDNPPGNYEKFNGETLQFDVRITRFG